MSALLVASDVAAGYHGHPIVTGLNLSVRKGEVCALLGPNGAGKTTTLLTLAGELAPLGGEILFDGVRTTAPLHARARRGLSFVTEERSVFMRLTVAENLILGRSERELALSIFPELEPLLQRRAGLLSGGEQQMLSLARALSRKPKVLLVDELSLGLAPLVVERLLRAVRSAADAGVGVLLVEQHARKALEIADHALIMRRGEVVLSGPAAEIGTRLGDIEEAYLSSIDGERS